MTKIVKSALAVLLAFSMCFAFVGCSCAKQEEPTASAPVDPLPVSDTGAQATPTAETEPFWVLIVGNDTRTGTVEITEPEYADGNARSDTIMLAYVDPTSYHISLVTIPRDTKIDLNGQPNKMNSSYQAGGIDLLKTKITELTGVTPKYTMDTSFVNFEKMIDALGGVDANVPINLTLDDIVSGNEINLSAGDQHLDGPSALVLARSRKQYGTEIESCRQIQDRQLVQNCITKVASNPAGAAAVATTMVGCINTNWDTASLIATVANFSEHADSITFSSGSTPYTAYIDDETQLWFAERDEQTSRKVIAAAESGEDMQAIVPMPSVYAG